jgi:hypothetical protein
MDGKSADSVSSLTKESKIGEGTQTVVPVLGSDALLLLAVLSNPTELVERSRGLATPILWD